MGSIGSSSSNSANGNGGFLGFLTSIPLWAYILIAVLGLLLTALLFVLSGRSRRNGGGGGALAGGIVALLALVIAPLTLMTIGLTNGGPSKPGSQVAGAGTGFGSTSTGGTGSTTSSSSTGGYGSSGGSTTSSSGSSSSGSTSSGGGLVEQQVSAAAQMLQSQVPIRQGPVTITAASANGNELTIRMTVPTALGEGAADMMRQGAMSSQCANPQVAQLINSGVKYTYIVTDSDGDESSFSIDHC